MASSYDLRKGIKTHCGCSKSYLLDLTGQKFGILTVIKRTSQPIGVNRTENRPRSYWYCECDCGGSKIVRTSSLKNGCTKSCGCLNGKRKKK